MSGMKCPFCQQELVEIQFGEQRYWTCINDRCDKSVGLGGNKKLWQELITTRKALDVALDELEDCEEWFGGSKLEKHFMLERIYKAYDEINEIKGVK